MSHVKMIVFAFVRVCEPAYAAVLAQGAHAVFTSRQYFMRIGLMADIPNNFVFGRLKDIMKRYGEFHGTQSGP